MDARVVSRWIMATVLGAVLCGYTSASEHATDSAEPSAATTSPAPRADGAYADDCSQARPIVGPGPEAGDLVVGPLWYGGLADGYPTVDGKPAEPGPDGLVFYKAGPSLKAGSEATVSIGTAARGYAGILAENGRDGGYSEVTFTSCKGPDAGEYSGWVSGFLLRGRTTACVPLEITVKGDPAVHRFDLALPKGACS